MKRFAAMAVAFLMVCSAAWAADKDAKEDASQVEAEITRFLTAIEFGPMMKGALLNGIPEADRGDPTVRKLVQLPEQRYTAVAASLFRTEVSLENARKMVQFYTSGTMKKVMASQNAQGADSAVVVSPAEYKEYEAFMKSEAGRAAVRIAESFTEPQFQEKFLTALDKEISK